ncbi:PqqD family protein [Risungbinella massiliensis]|uniref:PqqD family protein n=1 Tax=Risungbinella massiliensis TaxID=1329796 RepID=UPI0005CC07DB|nr:PqqD family protein [Risungbinella massiliensis]
MTRYIVPKEIVFNDIDNGAFIYNSKTEMCFGLDEVALSIWKMIHAGESVGSIVRNIQNKYTQDEALVERDVNDLIDRLVEHSLLIALDD